MKVQEIIIEAGPTFNRGNTTPGGVIVPDDFKLASASDGKFSFEFEGKRYSGSPKDIVDQLKSNGVSSGNAISDTVKRRGPGMARRILGGFTAKSFGLLVVVGSVAESVLAYAEQIIALREIFKRVILQGSPLDLNNPVYQEAASYYTKTLAAEVAVATVGELLRVVAAGGIMSLLRKVRLLQAALASTGWGAIIAILVWALTEGALWTFKWAVRKYGPDFFRAQAVEAINDATGPEVPNASAPAPARVDRAEVRTQMQRDADERRSTNAQPQSAPASSNSRLSSNPDIPFIDTSK